MEIIEQTTIGKRSQLECEDGITANEHFAAVIDGSTSKTPTRVNPEMSNGRHCMELIRHMILRLPKETSVLDFCREASNTIRSEYGRRGIDMQRLKANPAERLTASVAIYSSYHKQVWLVGDCQCIVDGVLHENSKPQEAVMAGKRAAFLAEAIAKGLDIDAIQTADPGREHIKGDLVRSCEGQNVCYAVVDGFDIPTDKIKVVNVNDATHGIVLASDGYPFLKETLDESEKALAALLAEDPLCIYKFKATKGLMKGNKSFDDRCYIRFTDA